MKTQCLNFIPNFIMKKSINSYILKLSSTLLDLLVNFNRYSKFYELFHVNDCCCLVDKLCFSTSWTVAHEAPLSIEFPRQDD